MTDSMRSKSDVALAMFRFPDIRTAIMLSK
jgi:hypothetical protein